MVNHLGDLYAESGQTLFSSSAFFEISILMRSTGFSLLRTFGVEVEKTMENHLVDPTEKAENAESSENVTDKRNQKYITPNNRLTIIVQQCATNTR